MNRLLTNEELEKLNSNDGIIELLCNIPNFNSSMYEELDEETKALVDYTLSIRLITNSQIDSNLRRSMEYNNLALLNNRKLTALSLLYFGIKDENNRYIGYICPYTGKYYDLNELNYELSKPYNDRNKDKILELEHIRPHSSGGGTILFNTIPSSVEANSFAEKSNLHLLDWFCQSGSKYYNKERLYNLVNYILSAYSISFKEYLDSNLEYSYDFEYNDDLETDNVEVENPIKYKTKNKKNIEIEDYIPFVNSLINKLKDDGYNIEEFNYRLEELQNNGIINDIDKYTNTQEIIENLFKEYSSDDNTSYLTYSLNIDYIKLSNSINTTNKEEIESILRNRLSIIKNIVDNTNKTMKDYFISLRDNQEIDIIYKDVPTEEEIEVFIKNIKLGINGKIDAFIETINDSILDLNNKNNVFSTARDDSIEENKKYFKGHEDIEIKNSFWRHNKERIIFLLFEGEYKDDSKYDIARRNISNNKFNNDNIEMCKAFIETINDSILDLSNKNNVFSIHRDDSIEENKKYFKGHEDIEIKNSFWSNYDQERIIPLLFYNMQYDSKEKKFIESDKVKN